jgi:hypothetical protein
MKIGHQLLLSFDRGIERRGRFLEFIPAARVAKADNLALVNRQAVFLDGVTRPGTAIVDAIFKAEAVGHFD